MTVREEILNLFYAELAKKPAITPEMTTALRALLSVGDVPKAEQIVSCLTTPASGKKP